MAQPDATRRYAIRGGNEGKTRLDVLARVLLPTTTQLLDRVGLIAGMKCLDVGLWRRPRDDIDGPHRRA